MYLTLYPDRSNFRDMIDTQGSNAGKTSHRTRTGHLAESQRLGRITGSSRILRHRYIQIGNIYSI